MVEDKRPVIVLAGFSCTGKSTIAERLVDLYGFNLMEQYVIYNSIAVAKGYRRTRYWLAEVGNEVFVKEITLETVRRINALETSKGIVIDASYGPLMDTILRSSLINTRIIIVAVGTEQSVRERRLVGRMETSDEEAKVELAFRDGFLEEVNLKKIMEEADFEVVNKGNIEEVLDQIANELAKLGVLKP